MAETLLQYHLRMREEYRDQISRIVQVGQKTKNDSGGSSREVEETELKEARKALNDNEKKISALQRAGSFKLKANW